MERELEVRKWKGEGWLKAGGDCRIGKGRGVIFWRYDPVLCRGVVVRY